MKKPFELFEFGDDRPSQFPANTIGLSAETEPTLMWASQTGMPMRADTGSTQTNQFFATKVRQRIVGRYLAIAPVFVGAHWNFTDKRPFTTGSTDGLHQIAATLELPDGTQSLNFSSPNTGGTLIPITFDGATTSYLRQWSLLVGDLIFASNHGREFWEFADENVSASSPHQQPWLRCAVGKATATSVLPVHNECSAAAPRQDAVAIGTSFAQMQTLIGTAGISSYNGTNNWGSGDTDAIFSCLGWVGIPLDPNHCPVFFMGTSIPAGETEVTNRRPAAWPTPFGTGTDWSVVLHDATVQGAGYPMWAMGGNWTTTVAQNAFPGLHLAVGASALAGTFSSSNNPSSWSTFVTNMGSHGDVERARGLICELSKYFPAMVAQDVHNDNFANVADYVDCLETFTRYIRRANPRIKLFGARVPSGGPRLNTTADGYPAGLDARWTAQADFVSNKLWDGLLDLRDPSSGNLYPNVSTVLTLTTAAGSTTTNIVLTSSVLPKYWVNSWVTIGGETRRITACEGTSLTVTAFSSPPGAGVAVQIQSNWAGGATGLDTVHANSHGARQMAGRFLSELQKFVPMALYKRVRNG